MSDPVDWSKFPAMPEQTAYCRCGQVYRTNAKLVRGSEGFKMVAQTPCPSCGRTEDFRKVSSDPESWSIGK